MTLHVFAGSTRVRRASYDPDTRVVHVLFPDGKRWAYQDVSPDEFEGFINAASPGRYLREVLDPKTNGPGSFPPEDL